MSLSAAIKLKRRLQTCSQRCCVFLHYACNSQHPAWAEEGTATAAPAPTAEADAEASSSSSTSSSSAPSTVLQPFVDNEYELQVPSNYTYVETPIVRVERGPQPERSPVLGRFEAPQGAPGTISILMRRANALKQTILQVGLKVDACRQTSARAAEREETVRK